ncbi:hypothetical protein G6F68_018760 [Rhizopus microsporus]|nr:hypothetical protein G6F68_018760 [Rhizopus microsporus]
MEILKNTPKHIESVNVEPNGHIVIIDEHPSLPENQEDTDSDEQEEKDVPAIVELSDDDDNLSIPSSPKSTQQPPASATVDLISSDEEDGQEEIDPYPINLPTHVIPFPPEIMSSALSYK